jgi:hypothetical protein
LDAGFIIHTVSSFVVAEEVGESFSIDAETPVRFSLNCMKVSMSSSLMDFEPALEAK